MERQSAQPTFTDLAVSSLGGPRTASFLQRCEELIPWQRLVDSIAHLFAQQPKGGRPFTPAMVLIKCVMLQKWYGLSDPQLEEQLQDRISFRRFVGLSTDDPTPDETTLVRFRNRLREAGCASTLFESALASLREKGLVLKEGTLVDATIVDAPLGNKRKDGSSSKDPCATYTVNHGAPRHGYKAHLATDAHGIITDWVFDTAKVHDSRHIDQLIATEDKAVYADSAYRNYERRAKLEAAGIKCMVSHKRERGQGELTPAQKEHNTAVARVRAFVEHPRAWMSKMGYLMARYRGLSRNALDFALMAVAYNFKRSFSLLGQPLT